jgi:hypothetical protein
VTINSEKIKTNGRKCVMNPTGKSVKEKIGKVVTKIGALSIVIKISSAAAYSLFVLEFRIM